MIAAPLLGASAVARLGQDADELVSLGFPGASPWYGKPEEITDSAVADALAGGRLDLAAPQRVWIPLAAGAPLPGELKSAGGRPRGEHPGKRDGALRSRTDALGRSRP